MSSIIDSLDKQKRFSSNEVAIQNIPLELIQPDPNQVRLSFDEEKLKELADSIKDRGIQNPVHVRTDNVDEGQYIILTGERRYKAAQIAGLDNIPCIVHTEKMSESDIKTLQLIENLQRQDLTAIEISRGFEGLKRNGMDQREIARSLGLSETLVSRGLNILKRLPDDWIAKIETNCPNKSINELYNIAKQPNKNKRASMYQKMMEDAGKEVEIEMAETQRKKTTSQGGF